MHGLDDIEWDLDILCQNILHALEQHDGEATTSEIRDFIGVESRSRLNYRINEYLVPQGLVSTHQPEPEPGDIPPKELILTEDGEAALAALAEQADVNQDIAERVDQLETQMATLQEQMQDLHQRVDEGAASSGSTSTASTTSEVSQSDVDDLQEQIANLAMELEDLKDDPLFDEDIRANIDQIRAGTLALSDYVMHKFEDREEVADLNAKYEGEIEPLAEN